MQPLTQQDILAHQARVPWPSLRQVEQDLLLCRAMVAIFNDEFLASQIAMRGGTLLHKVYLAPPARFSEDIDLVVYGDRPEQHIRKALRRVLDDVLGPPRASLWDSVRLAVRNTVRPSRILKLIYAVPHVGSPGPALQVVVEANVTERNPHSPIEGIPFAFPFRLDTLRTTINGYDIHEMLGTKMRALFQRRRGRDLFDLYWALQHGSASVDPRAVVDSFVYYLQQEGSAPGRDEFIAILDSHLADHGFCSDTDHLLRQGVPYDPQQAGECVRERLLNLLPDR